MTDKINETIVAIRGSGDLGTGVVHCLSRCGFKVIILEKEYPTVIRRKVAFAQAVYDGEIEVDGIKAVKVKDASDIDALWSKGNIPLLIDPEMKILDKKKVDVLVDAILARRNLGMNMKLAPLTIALGPGFRAGVDVHVVIETQRGHNLGRMIFDGYATPNTSVPEPVAGYASERLLRAPCNGQIKHVLDIGDIVKKGDTICYVNDTAVRAEIAGVVRGLSMHGLQVHKGLKIGDVDPRGIKEHCYTISDKARAIGGGVLVAILYLSKIHGYHKV